MPVQFFSAFVKRLSTASRAESSSRSVKRQQNGHPEIGSIAQFVGDSVKIVSNSRPSGRAYSRGAWRVRYAWRPAGPRAGGSKLGPAARRPPANRTARGGPEWPKRVVTTRPTGRTARNCPKTGLAQRIRRFAQPTDSAEVARNL